MLRLLSHCPRLAPLCRRLAAGLVAALLLAPTARAQAAPDALLSADSVRTPSGFVVRDGWRYHPGDHPRGSDPALGDEAWARGGSHLIPDAATEHPWPGRGWFRLRIHVDSALVGVPLGLHVVQAGASEIYLDGRLLHRLGRVAGAGTPEAAQWDQSYPHGIVFDGTEHVLAVRYSNTSTLPFRRLGFGQGFYLQVGDLHVQLAERVERERAVRTMQVVFTLLPVAFALLHLLIFAFYRAARENLYYALLTLFIGLGNFIDLQAVFAGGPAERVLLARLAAVSGMLAALFGLRFGYSLWSRRLPRQYAAFVAIGLALLAWRLVRPDASSNVAMSLFTFVLLAEVLRVVVRSADVEGAAGWLMGGGMVLAITSMMLQTLINLGLLAWPFVLQPHYVGVLLMLASVSVYLSERFASTNRSLERQLAQVRALTDRTLAQERHARELEVQQRLLEADNDRKTRELEAARRLQLSMLPRHIPAPAHLDIAVYMKTATEVGGDYYDFHLAPDGTLTIAVGDATGHGTAAGTMVAVVKSLFTAIGSTADLREVFHKCTRVIKPMGLGPLYMALQLVRIEGHRLTATSAGMPFPLLFRAGAGRVDALPLKGMPLGLTTDFPYAQVEQELAPGDTLLLMSDGLAELFNDDRETLDYERVHRTFEDTAHRPPEDIIRRLRAEGDHWRGAQTPHDDITFVVVQVRPQTDGDAAARQRRPQAVGVPG